MTYAGCSPNRTSSGCRSRRSTASTGTRTLMLNMAVEEIAKADASARR